MTTIHLSEFTDYTDEHLFDFIKMHDDIDFEIVFPKTYNPTDDESFMIFWEFHIMAFIGQCLSEIASQFSYFVPDPKSNKPFQFFLTSAEHEKLASILTEVSVLLNNTSGVYNAVEFQYASTNFFSNAFDNKIEAATWGLLTTANSFLAE